MRSFKKCSAVILSLALIAVCFAGLAVSAETAKGDIASAAAGGTVIPVGETTYDFTKLTTKTLAAGTEGFEGFSGSVTQLSKSGEEYVKFSKTAGELDFVVDGKWSATFSGGTKGTKGLLITAPDGKLYGNKGGDTGLVLSNMPAGTYKITAVRTACDADDGTGKTLSLTANNGYLTTAVFTVESSEPPEAVTNLTANAGDGKVALSWDVSQGATSYEVTVNGGAPVTTEDTRYIEAGLNNDTEYTFTVTAVNNVGKSAPVSVTATPKEPTDPPQAFTLSGEASDKAAVLIWTASEYAKTYDVYKDGTVIATDLNDTSYTVTGLTNDTEYSFKVEAKNKNGKTASNEVKVIPVEPPPSQIEITKQIGELETAIVEWTNPAAVDKYNVYVKPVGGTYTKIDDELVRFYGSYYRADAVGLAAGKYKVKIAAVVGGAETDFAETNDIDVKAHIREGFAFDPKSPNYDSSGIGAYKPDGTLKDGAQVLYIDNENKDTVKFTVKVSGKDTEGVGLVQILSLREKNGAETTPLAIRMIGQVESPAGKNSSGYVQLKACKNITFEGIGNDATTYHWSFLLRSAVNTEVRNLAVMEFYDDGISLDTDNFNCWIHNCDIFYGQDRGSDQKKGDGSLDVKAGSDYCTFSYNHFWDSGKCSLCGMKEDSYQGYRMTYYGNWFDHSDSRMPRIRGDQVHVYNNYYDGNSKYGVGACTGSSAFVENNVFRNVKYPILTSMQGSDVAGGNTGTFSSEDGGVVKEFNNEYIDGSQSHPVVTYQQNSVEFDAYAASSRDEKVPAEVKAKQGDGTYSNFDTAADMYKYNPLPTDEVVAAVQTYAGRVEGGDFYHEFNDEADDSNYDRDPVLGGQLQQYKSSIVKTYISAGTYPGTGGALPTTKPTPDPVQYTAYLNVTGGTGTLSADEQAEAGSDEIAASMHKSEPDKYRFLPGTVVRYSGTADDDRQLPMVTVTASDGSSVTVDNDTFVMPAKSVTVDVVYLTPIKDDGVYYETAPQMSGKTVTAKIVNKTDESGALFVAAAYEKGVLVESKTEIVKKGEAAQEVTLTFSNEHSDVRYFLWSAGSIKPYSNMLK